MKLTYVLFPEDADYLHKLHQVDILEEKYVGVSGKKKYTSIIENPSDFIHASSDPFCIPLERDYLEYTAEDNNNIIQLIIGIYKKYGITLSGVEVQPSQGFTCYFPKYDGDYIYEDIIDIVTIDHLLGRRFVSHSPLALLYEERDFYGVKIEDGIVTSDASQTFFIGPENMHARDYRIDSFVKEKTEKGFVVAGECPICLEFSIVWDLEKRIMPGEVVYKPKIEITHFSNWMKDSVRRIGLGRTPLWRIEGDDKEVAWRSFEQLTRSNYWLRERSNDLHVSGGIITFPVISPKDVEIFTQAYETLTIVDELRDEGVVLPVSVKGVVKEDGTVVTPDGLVHNINTTQERWEEGEHLTPWGGYFLQHHNLYSIALTKQ